MTPEQVDGMLRNYRLCKGRSEHLKVECEILERRIARLKCEAMSDAALTGQKYDGMPHGTDTADMTARIAVRFSDGFKPQYITEAEQDLQLLIEQRENAESCILFVEAWLRHLDERERFFIEEKMIDGKSWRVILDEYCAKHGIIFSKAGAKKIVDRALNKIYLMGS